jgi:hypothetical protein
MRRRKEKKKKEIGKKNKKNNFTGGSLSLSLLGLLFFYFLSYLMDRKSRFSLSLSLSLQAGIIRIYTRHVFLSVSFSV